MRDDSSRRTFTVDLVAVRESTALALYGLHETMASVGVAWEFVTGVACDAPRFKIRIVAADTTPYAGALGAPIAPTHSFAEATDGDMVIAPDLAISPHKDPRGRWPEAAAWLRQRHAEGAVVCSVCSGTVLLAEAGLLDDAEATTHWAYKDLFAHFYPQVQLKPERILSPIGEDARIVTSGGASSWEDLALYLIDRFCGREAAVRTAKLFLFGDRSDGQLPFAAPGAPKRHGDRVIQEAQSWIAEHYADSSPSARMAAAAGLSERSFSRRFRQATGVSPVQYVQTLRIEEAKQMLERSDLTVDGVAYEIGYEDPTHFRRLFKRQVGVTPAHYRRRFRSVAPMLA